LKPSHYVLHIIVMELWYWGADIWSYSRTILQSSCKLSYQDNTLLFIKDRDIQFG